MPIISLKTGTKSRSLLVGNPYFVPSSYESIASNSPTSGNSITFNSISGTYASLQLRILGFDNGAGGRFAMQFNSDTGTNYTRHVLSGEGSTVGTAGNTLRTFCQLSSFYSNPSSTYGYGIITDIHDYASSTKYKTVRTLSGQDLNGSGEITMYSNLWLNTNAITSITISTDGTFSSGTTISLYGIKGA